MIIDNVTVVRGVIIVRGWSSSSCPVIYYNHEKIRSSGYRLRRSDLVTVFGDIALDWGFCIISVPNVERVLHELICIKTQNGQAIEHFHSNLYPSQENNIPLNLFKAAVHEDKGRLLEIGSRARSGNLYREYFPIDIQYIGLDISSGPNVDVVGDAHHLSKYFDEKFDFVFSVSVFEHLLMPWKTAIEMNKVMKLGGLAYIQSHQSWPLHEEPWDFWRFSDKAWFGLFNEHTGFRIIDTYSGMPCMIVPQNALGGSTQDLDTQIGKMVSACVIKKIAPSRVHWEAEAQEVYNLSYNHR